MNRRSDDVQAEPARQVRGDEHEAHAQHDGDGHRGQLASSTISEPIEEAIESFAAAYVNQTPIDCEALVEALPDGRADVPCSLCHRPSNPP